MASIPCWMQEAMAFLKCWLRWISSWTCSFAIAGNSERPPQRRRKPVVVEFRRSRGILRTEAATPKPTKTPFTTSLAWCVLQNWMLWFLDVQKTPGEQTQHIYIHMHMHISWCAQRITNCANPGIWPKESFNRNISLAVQTDYVLYCIMIDAVTQRKRVTVQLSANPTMSAFPDAPPNPKHSGRFTTILLLDMWVTVIKAQNEAPRRTN